MMKQSERSQFFRVLVFDDRSALVSCDESNVLSSLQPLFPVSYVPLCEGWKVSRGSTLLINAWMIAEWSSKIKTPEQKTALENPGNHLRKKSLISCSIIFTGVVVVFIDVVVDVIRYMAVTKLKA